MIDYVYRKFINKLQEQIKLSNLNRQQHAKATTKKKRLRRQFPKDSGLFQRFYQEYTS